MGHRVDELLQFLGFVLQRFVAAAQFGLGAAAGGVFARQTLVGARDARQRQRLRQDRHQGDQGEPGHQRRDHLRRGEQAVRRLVEHQRVDQVSRAAAQDEGAKQPEDAREGEVGPPPNEVQEGYGDAKVGAAYGYIREKVGVAVGIAPRAAVPALRPGVRVQDPTQGVHRSVG